MLASLDHQACNECRSRTIYCDGTQPFCLKNETMNQKVEQRSKKAEQSESEEEDDKNRSSSRRGSQRKLSSQKASFRKASSQKAPSKKDKPASKQESKPVESFHPTSNDMILSLKDDRYRTALFRAFRKLGAKKESERDKDVERQTKLDVFNSFKDAGTRFLKHINYRKPDLGLIEADEAYARDSKCYDNCF